MKIEITILTDLKRCDEIFSLYRGNSGRLGFMPRGAFEERILNKHLLIATSDNALVGYLLFRIVNRRAAIAHLCVSKKARGRGVAKSLIDVLKKQTAHLEGITLKCRNDFEAHSLWPRLGFVAKCSAIGRGIDRARLTVWHIDHGHPDLFSLETSKTRVVIDANVFFDLWVEDRSTREISAALTEPWVDDIIELMLTPEIYNDIQRSCSIENQAKSKSMVTAFEQVRVPVTEVDKVVEKLQKLYANSSKITLRDQSDIRHLAFTIVSGVKYFVTRDEAILDKSPEILEQHDIYVFSPIELISHLDWLIREQQYQPLRLAGSSITFQRATAGQIETLISTFKVQQNERLRDFRVKLEALFLNPTQCEVQVCSSSDKNLLALLGIKALNENIIELSCVRLTKQGLSSTVLRHMLMLLIRTSIEKGFNLLCVTDNSLSEDTLEALLDVGFLSVDGKWIKPLLCGFFTLLDLEQRLISLGAFEKLPFQPGDVDQIESFIWPAKIINNSIPCYLIPIRAEWAEHFFDVELALQRLPGISDIRDDLHLGVEAVYYSASKVSLKAPGRILWYVSQGNEKNGTMQIKACSILREVVRDGPKSLFKRFRRLGVYQWKDIYDLSKSDINNKLMALRFSHTELFDIPVNVNKLEELKVLPPYLGPRPIPHPSFVEIYNTANTITA